MSNARHFRRLKINCLVIVLLTIVLEGCMRRVVSVQELDQRIQDEVPIGSEKQRVKEFIDNLKVDALQIGRDSEFHKATPKALGNRDPEKVAELGDRIAEFIGAIIIQAESDGISRFKDIVIQFYIDKDGRLIGYTVKLVGSE